VRRFTDVTLADPRADPRPGRHPHGLGLLPALRRARTS
jgi:hypothetical protein